MQSKDKQFLVDIFGKVSASVTTVNEKILAHQRGGTSTEELLVTTALEQLAMQHQIVTLLATMAFDPGTGAHTLPELPKKIIGFQT
jgi:hypothetical protein